MGSDVCADMVVDGGWQSQIEQPVSVSSPRQRWQMGAELVEWISVIIPATQVGVLAEEDWETLTLSMINLREISLISENTAKKSYSLEP